MEGNERNDALAAFVVLGILALGAFFFVREANRPAPIKRAAAPVAASERIGRVYRARFQFLMPCELTAENVALAERLTQEALRAPTEETASGITTAIALNQVAMVRKDDRVRVTDEREGLSKFANLSHPEMPEAWASLEFFIESPSSAPSGRKPAPAANPLPARPAR